MLHECRSLRDQIAEGWVRLERREEERDASLPGNVRLVVSIARDKVPDTSTVWHRVQIGCLDGWGQSTLGKVAHLGYGVNTRWIV